MGGRYRHNQLLEDLRHHQEKLAQEKKQWAQEKENLDLEMKTKKEELAKYQVITALFKTILEKSTYFHNNNNNLMFTVLLGRYRKRSERCSGAEGTTLSKT